MRELTETGSSLRSGFCFLLVIAFSLSSFTVCCGCREEERELNAAREYLRELRVDDALAIIRKYRREMESKGANGDKWLNLFVDACVIRRDNSQLARLYEFEPGVFGDKEEASLLIAGYYLDKMQLRDYRGIRDRWEKRGKSDSAWFFLKVKERLSEGNRAEAVSLLRSRSFEGKDEQNRLIRLALIHFDENPEISREYLRIAREIDPANSDMRLYLAEALENLGDERGARREYRIASEMGGTAFYHDQLADFLIRNRQYDSALAVLRDSWRSRRGNETLVKAIFWSKVVKPSDFDWRDRVCSPGRSSRFASYLACLGAGKFWDEAAFNSLPQKEDFVKLNQEVFWLRLLAALSAKREKEALDLLKFNHFAAVSWRPDLENALKRILVYRDRNTLDYGGNTLFTVEKGVVDNKIPELFLQLELLAEEEKKYREDFKMPDDVRQLLLSEDAFAAAFLVAGWKEAALNLRFLEVVPDTFPDWYASLTVDALRQNRSGAAALNFAEKQVRSDALRLAIAETLWAEKDPDAALAGAESLADVEDSVGYRAALLAAEIYVDKGELERAKRVVNSRLNGCNDLAVKEISARIAYLAGDRELADSLYAEISGQSSEAKSYLAKMAFLARDWKTAKRLTEELLDMFPENSQLRSNLATIVERERIAMLEE